MCSMSFNVAQLFVYGKWSVFFSLFGVRLVPLFKELYCLLFNIGPLISRSAFSPTTDMVPDRAVPFTFDVLMSLARFWTICLFCM